MSTVEVKVSHVDGKQNMVRLLVMRLLVRGDVTLVGLEVCHDFCEREHNSYLGPH